MDREALIGAWRDCIRGADKSWVLFAQGTCVILTQPEPDLAAQARALLAEWGAVQVGTPAGDFGVITLDNGRGWVVTGHHPDILTFVLARNWRRTPASCSSACTAAPGGARMPRLWR